MLFVVPVLHFRWINICILDYSELLTFYCLSHKRLEVKPIFSPLIWFIKRPCVLIFLNLSRCRLKIIVSLNVPGAHRKDYTRRLPGRLLRNSGMCFRGPLVNHQNWKLVTTTVLPSTKLWSLPNRQSPFWPDVTSSPFLSMWRSRCPGHPLYWGLLCWCGFTLIPAWIIKCIHDKMWDEITYSFPNLNGANVELCEWISYFISHFTGHVSTCWD